jgi:hypothetical protein
MPAWRSLAHHADERTNRRVGYVTRCGNTIHSNYVTDHRCVKPRGHDGDCVFGADAVALIEAARNVSSLGWDSLKDKPHVDAMVGLDEALAPFLETLVSPSEPDE